MFSDNFKDKYLKEVGLEKTNREEIRQAYETAHRVREFEIELYWKRTAYIWAMQAALIGIAMFLRTGGETTISFNFFSITSSTAPTASSLIAILLVSTLAFVVAGLWLLLIKGAKFWHDNWERHVDLLGQHLGQNLYQVYPLVNHDKLSIDPQENAPFSVTKINSYVVCAFIWFWLFNLIWALWDLSVICAAKGNIELTLAFIGWTTLYALAAFFFCVQFTGSKMFTGLKMSNFGTQVDGLQPDQDNGILYTRRTHWSNDEHKDKK